MKSNDDNVVAGPLIGKHPMRPGATPRVPSPLCRATRLLPVLLLAGCAVSPPDTLGLVDGALAPCPEAPHCVCSEPTERHAPIEPLAFTGDPAGAFDAAAAAVAAIGGSVVERRGDYLHATFTTRWLRFVDDLQLRLDAGAGVIHVRSSSRVGYYDFNVNRNRVERLRDAW